MRGYSLNNRYFERIEQIKESLKMETKEISVIVPVYNVEKYLQRCIDSILSQTLTDFELLLIDDGSIDASGKICDEYAEKDERVRVFHKKNGGVSSARNMGLDNARGKFITFIDSDDWIDKNHLFSFLVSPADLVFQGYKQIASDSKTIELIKNLNCHKVFSKNEILEVLYELFSMGMVFGPIWNKLFKAQIINENRIRFYEDISFREDEIFTFQYCKFIRSLVSNESITYNYVQYNTSLMHKSYIDPEELIHIFDLSRNVSLNLNPQYDFTIAINKYYTESLIWSGWLMYYKNKLYPRNKRILLLRKIISYVKLYPVKGSKQFIMIDNPYINDALLIIRNIIKFLIKL